MSLLRQIVEGRTSMEELFSEANEAKYFSRGLWTTATGLAVSPETALSTTAVLACIRVLSETVASLPLVIYRRLPEGGKERALDHYLYPILHDQANPEMTSFEFRELAMSHVAGWGNAYAEIELDGSGRVLALWPLRPDRMRVYRVRLEGRSELVYVYRLPDSVGIPSKTLREYQVLHVRGLSPDGIVGYSPIQLARQAVGLSLAMEEYGARFFGNGANADFVLEHPSQLSDDALRHLRESWEEDHLGLEKAHRMAILEEGMKIEKIGIPPDDAQFIQSRKFQINEIARMYRIPPHMIGDLERATFSNIEHQAIEFVVHCIRPHLVRWEQRLRRSLFAPEEAKTYFPEFLVDGLLRGDVQTRFAAYATARQNGWMNANEIRELENQNPIEDGEVYLVPLNMIPMGSPSAATTEQARGSLPPGTSLVPLKDYARWIGRQPLLESGGNGRASQAGEKKRAARDRLAIAKSYRRVFQDAGERAVKRELREIKQAAQKYLDKRAHVADFEEWVRGYYRDFPQVLSELWSPAFSALSEAVQALAAREVEAPVGMTPGLDECLRYHVDRSVARHVGLSQTLVLQALRMSEGAADTVLEALEDWPERRPASFAAWETIRTSNLMAKATWFYAGAEGLEWIRLDENPFCASLDGLVIEMSDNCRGTHFVMEGEEVPGRSDSLKPSWNVSTPPLFEGCECQIAPVMPEKNGRTARLPGDERGTMDYSEVIARALTMQAEALRSLGQILERTRGPEIRFDVDHMTQTHAPEINVAGPDMQPVADAVERAIGEMGEAVGKLELPAPVVEVKPEIRVTPAETKILKITSRHESQRVVRDKDQKLAGTETDVEYQYEKE